MQRAKRVPHIGRDCETQRLEYDPARNGWLSYNLAIKEIRRRGVLDGRFDPATDAEREMVERVKGGEHVGSKN